MNRVLTDKKMTKLAIHAMIWNFEIRVDYRILSRTYRVMIITSHDFYYLVKRIYAELLKGRVKNHPLIAIVYLSNITNEEVVFEI